jgi:hypothetical protein
VNVSYNQRPASSGTSEERSGMGLFVLVPAEEAAQFRSLIPHGIDVLGLQEVVTENIILDVSGSLTFLSAVASTSCLALAAIGDDGYVRACRARDLLSAWAGKEFALPLRIHGSTAERSLPSKLLGLVLERFHAVCRQCTTYAANLGRLRGAHEELQNNFAGLEAFVVAANIQPIQLAFINPPSTGQSLQGSGTAEVTQILPTSTYGLSSIDIHFGPSDRTRRYGTLELELMTLEEKRIRARWQLAADLLGHGWTSLRLPKALSGIERTPVLMIRILGGLGDMPPLSLGAPQPLKAFRASVSPRQSVATNASLALRCWTGLPGVSPPNITCALDATPMRRSAVRRASIPFPFLGQVEWIKTDWIPDFKPVSFAENERAILCHPPTDGITLAALPEMSLNEVGRIDGLAGVDNEKSSPVEFALFYSDRPASDILGALSAQQAVSSDPPILDWATASWGQPTPVSCSISPSHRKGRLFFATRMQNGRANDYAWATFRDLQITFLGLSDAHQPLPQRDSGIAETNAQKRRYRRLSLIDLKRARLTETGPGCPTLRIDHATSAIHCDFAPDGSLAAVIPLIHIKALTHLSLIAKASPLNSIPIDVGIAGSNPPNTEFAGPRPHDASSARSARVFSGWQTLEPDEEIVIDLDVKDLFQDLISLHLVARPQTPLRHPTSQRQKAHFSNIRLLDWDIANV